MEWLRNSLIVLSVMPVLPFLLVYYISVALGRGKKPALQLAMDVTTVFLLFSVSALFNNLFQNGFGFYLILLLVLISAGLIGGAQNRIKGRVDGKRLLRAVWRLGFLVMGTGYVIFMVFGMIKYILRVM
ncbi:DUF3397 domain-containing protein [Paenibacillus sp. URB8-2]|uniref:DUF3397 domain-containing protein n=1 Tax=Paenibacillus sp. URB8-2 TaxID=2741301 RepID=UPI0015C25629|nr:DUF3397 domain-containing protein [Paenibacillus sp. URB8-2]BCG60255.1 hypothetical protein PUR_36800 [Paenibacillus sp. URB8-2]